jgi:hypothetical protein
LNLKNPDPEDQVFKAGVNIHAEPKRVHSDAVKFGEAAAVGKFALTTYLAFGNSALSGIAGKRRD